MNELKKDQIVAAMQQYDLLTENGQPTENLLQMVAYTEAMRVLSGVEETEGRDDLHHEADLIWELVQMQDHSAATRVVRMLYRRAGLVYPGAFFGKKGGPVLENYLRFFCHAIAL